MLKRVYGQIQMELSGLIPAPNSSISVAFVSLETLRNAKPGDRMRMNVLFGYEGESARIGDRLSSIRSGETRIYSSFLDPAINDLGARNRAELHSLIAPLSVKTKE